MGRMAALLFDDMPKTVVLYKEDVSSRAWRPAGEMHLPPGSRGASLGFNGDMLMLVGDFDLDPRAMCFLRLKQKLWFP